jgi:SAM-dependent methyltransferase
MTKGWEDEENARRYDAYARRFPMYDRTSEDLVDRVGLTPGAQVVDLCCGTGRTTLAVLAALGAEGRVTGVDGAAAMLAIARAAVTDPRAGWVEAPAEEFDRHIPGPVDAVVCNSAIWQTDLPATFAAARRALRPGGRFAFNIGRRFLAPTRPHPRPETAAHPETAARAKAAVGHEIAAGAETAASAETAAHPETAARLETAARAKAAAGPETAARPETEAVGLAMAMRAIAAREYGWVAPPQSRPGPRPTPDGLLTALTQAGFTPDPITEIEFVQDLDEQRAWLSIPIFTERALPGLGYEQRMAVLAEAYTEPDVISQWTVFTATARTP